MVWKLLHMTIKSDSAHKEKLPNVSGWNYTNSADKHTKKSTAKKSGETEMQSDKKGAELRLVRACIKIT